MKIVNLETIIEMLSWYRIWLLSGSNRIRANRKILRKQRSLQKFLKPNRKPRVIYTANSLDFSKACEDLSSNHCTLTPHRSEPNGIAERAVRRVKEGTSAVLLHSGLDEKWLQIPWNAFPIFETFKISCLMGRLHTNTFWRTC